MMHRSFDRRVEVLTPILDPEIRVYIKDVILGSCLKDEVNARLLKSDGTYKRVAVRTGGGFDSQAHFIGLGTPS
jgi:polyphosphate kinase